MKPGDKQEVNQVAAFCKQENSIQKDPFVKCRNWGAPGDTETAKEVQDTKEVGQNIVNPVTEWSFVQQVKEYFKQGRDTKIIH